MLVWAKGALNEEQEAAVLQDGSVFLIACPGSGKTRTLTYKAASELSKLQSERKWVGAITYTNRAADEIHERIDQLGVETSQLWIGTIHAFCLEWILRPYSIYHDVLKHGFSVINAHESEKIIVDICKRYSSPKITQWDCGHHYTSDRCILHCKDNTKTSSIKAVLNEYRQHLRDNRLIDFELILKCAHTLLVKNPSISKLLAGIFTCILVDEFQDTREIQYLILAEILKAGSGSVTTFIVGDPNQAIYGSLGGYAVSADEFNTMAHIELHEMELSRNYRSSKRIIDYFREFNVHDTTIVSAAQHSNYTGIISYDTSTSRDALADELVRLIRYNIETVGLPPHEVCVLAPWWAHLASMTRRLMAALPEYSFDGPGMVPFARDIENFWYKVSKIALSEPAPTMYVRRLRWAGEVLKGLEGAGIDVSGLTRKSLLREFNSIHIEEGDGLTHLEAFFVELFSRIDIDPTASRSLMEQYGAFFESSRSRIQLISRDGVDFSGIDSFRRAFKSRGGITVSTIHGVKGAEYDAVIAYALLKDIVPHFSDPEQEDSAMRLLYVIASRARKNLHLISETERYDGRGDEYLPTQKLASYSFAYDTGT